MQRGKLEASGGQKNNIHMKCHGLATRCLVAQKGIAFFFRFCILIYIYNLYYQTQTLDLYKFRFFLLVFFILERLLTS